MTIEQQFINTHGHEFKAEKTSAVLNIVTDSKGNVVCECGFNATAARFIAATLTKATAE